MKREELIHGDCLEVLCGLPDQCADAVVTDPPYGTGGRRRARGGAGSNPGGGLRRESWDEWDTSWVCRLPLLLKPQGKAVVFCPAVRFGSLMEAMEDIDMPYLTHVAWEKPDPMPPYKGRLANALEYALIFGRGALNTSGASGLWRESSPKTPVDSQDKHPYEKPLGLMRWIVGLVLPAATRCDQVVLDPFAGSGTTLVAARQLGFGFIGIEREAKYVEIARRRLAATAGPLFDAQEATP